MRVSRSVLLAVALLAPASVRAANVRLTIESARLDVASLPPHAHPMSTAQLSDLACLSLPGLREMAGFCGGKPVTARAPVSALVRVELGDRVIRTYAIPGNPYPMWQYSIVLDEATARQPARVLLVDDDGASARPLGEAQLPARALAALGSHKVAVGKHQLAYRVEALSDKAPPRVYQFRVPADQQMADLARNAHTAGPGYLVIPVAEGEIVEVSASGKVQPSAKKHPDRVAGPDGIPTIQTKIQFNQPGFRGCPGCDHAALIAQIGSTGMVIGSHRRFTVENSGLLVLAINDVKVSDNAGAFDVRVQVSLPTTVTALKKKGSAADVGPAGLDARVLQQIVDSHGDDLDTCAGRIKSNNLSGDVVLAFTITADGTPLVAVEKVSPNLKEVGECIRERATHWKFPRVTNVTTARCPLSFAPYPG
jgi:hypothetical protein